MSIRRYLQAIESPLTEAQNYLAMFNDLIGNNDTAKQAIDKYIKWARNTLKKNDRIVWFLRWVRIEVAGRMQHIDSDAELARLNKRLQTDFTRNDMVPINNLMTNLEHYLSMPIHPIQSVVWGKQSPQELLADFREMEADWRETSNERNLIDYPEGDEPKMILQFPDGYAWFDLETPYCDREAKAMGHCGNRASYKHGETILSLRKLARSADGSTYWYPVATFILDDNGVLGEMKGRANEKPTEKYHPYIIALLKHDIIQGIKGGGYRPEANFKMSDLDHETREELLKQKPDLGDVADLYYKEGMTPRVMDRLRNALYDHDLSMGDYQPEEKRFVVEKWKDFDQFLRNIYADDLEKILEIAKGEADFQHTPENVATEFARTLLDLPEHWQQKIIAHAGLTGRMEHQVREVAERLMQSNDEYYRKFEEVYSSGAGIREEAWDRLYQYADAGFSFASGHVWTDIPTDSLEEFRTFVESDQPIHLYVSEQDMVYYASSDDDDDYGYDLQRMRGDSSRASWDQIDGESQYEHWREEGLISGRRDGDEWLQGIDADLPELATEYLAALQGHQGGGRIDDPRQRDLFDSMRYNMNLVAALFG